MKISKAILKNAQSLLSTSLSLFALGQKYHAAHFAALSLEECTKSLMQIDSIKEKFKNKDHSSHFKKEELIGFFHYLAGRLSAMYTMKYMFDKEILGNKTNVQEHLLNVFLKSSGMKGIEGLEKCIDLYLESRKTWPIKPAFINNEIRKNSVYVDIEDGNLLTPKKRVSAKSIKQTIDDAKFAVSLMNMSLYNNFSWLEFLETYPKIHPHPSREAKIMLQKLRKGISKKK